MHETLKSQRRWKPIRDDDDWVLRGPYGQIAQYEDGDLDVWVTSPRIAAQLERTGWSATNHYDDGALFIRPVQDLDLAAKAIHAKRRRVMSPAVREAAIQRLHAARAKIGRGPRAEG